MRPHRERRGLLSALKKSIAAMRRNYELRLCASVQR